MPLRTPAIRPYKNGALGLLVAIRERRTSLLRYRLISLNDSDSQHIAAKHGSFNRICQIIITRSH